VSDFSTVLATSDRGGRDQLFSLLRRIFDGQAHRDIYPAPRALEWSGRLTILAACTPAIDNFASHADALGPRWVYCRPTPADTNGKRQNAHKALAAAEVRQHRADAAAIAAKLVADARADLAASTLDEVSEEALIDAAVVAAYGRAGVERHGYGRREVSAMAVIEEPPRLAGQLGLLTRALMALGVEEGTAVAIARRCALDSMPRPRYEALVALSERDTVTPSDIARRGLHRHVARFALEELDAIGLVRPLSDDEDDRYAPHPWTLAGPDAELMRTVISARQSQWGVWHEK
jgi:hypothetical protein